MCMFRVSYVGGNNESPLKQGEVYGVERTIHKGNGKVAFLIEGIDGEYDKALFHELEKKGHHLLVGEVAPKVGKGMRLVKKKTDMSEIMTGTVKYVEKSHVSGMYTAYTDKAVYEVSPIK